MQLSQFVNQPNRYRKSAARIRPEVITSHRGRKDYQFHVVPAQPAY